MLEFVKRQLGYSWADQEMNVRLAELMEQGQAYLKRFDPDIVWASANPILKGLLVSYVRYALANAEDDFHANYISELIALETAYEVRHADDV